MSTQRSSRAIARAAVAAATAAVGALALASPVSATLINQYIEVPQCAQPQTQVCEQIPTVNAYAKSDGPWLVEFTANKNHCSDIIAHAYFDGREWGSHIARPGQSDGGGYEIPSSYGLHQVEYQAEGVLGGCNTGRLESWGGVVRVYALYPD